MVKLTSDELGVAGEKLFAHLCGRAQLICNQSERDRTGWDFVVEFPMPGADGTLTLDRRAPTACSVQLKSTTTSGPVSLRLSSAERLAKHLGPSFVVVFRLAEAVYFNACGLGDAAVTYGVKVLLAVSPDRPGAYRSTRLVPLDARPKVDDLQEYGHDLAGRHGVTILIDPANLLDVTPDA